MFHFQNVRPNTTLWWCENSNLKTFPFSEWEASASIIFMLCSVTFTETTDASHSWQLISAITIIHAIIHCSLNFMGTCFALWRVPGLHRSLPSLLQGSEFMEPLLRSQVHQCFALACRIFVNIFKHTHGNNSNFLTLKLIKQTVPKDWKWKFVSLIWRDEYLLHHRYYFLF